MLFYPSISWALQPVLACPCSSGGATCASFQLSGWGLLACWAGLSLWKPWPSTSGMCLCGWPTHCHLLFTGLALRPHRSWGGWHCPLQMRKLPRVIQGLVPRPV